MSLATSLKLQLPQFETKKKISELEKEYMKLRSNEKKFDSSCIRFPKLEEIDTFSAGLVAVIEGIVTHLNQSITDFENTDSIMEKLVQQCKKVRFEFVKFLFGI